MVFMGIIGVVSTFYTFVAPDVLILLFHGFRYRVMLPLVEAWDGLAHSLSSP